MTTLTRNNKYYVSWILGGEQNIELYHCQIVRQHWDSKLFVITAPTAFFLLYFLNTHYNGKGDDAVELWRGVYCVIHCVCLELN